MIRSSGRGLLRARLAASKDVSLPFSLVAPPDQVYQPFGATLSALGHSSPPAAAVSQYVETVPTASGSASSDGTELDALTIVAFVTLILVTTLVFAVVVVNRRSAGGRVRGGLRPDRS